MSEPFAHFGYKCHTVLSSRKVSANEPDSLVKEVLPTNVQGQRHQISQTLIFLPLAGHFEVLPLRFNYLSSQGLTLAAVALMLCFESGRFNSSENAESPRGQMVRQMHAEEVVYRCYQNGFTCEEPPH